MNEREALKLALDALESSYNPNADAQNEAITAAKEVLAQPEQEPDFYMTKKMASQIKEAKTNWAICVNGNKFPTDKKTVPVFIGYTTPPQPKHEPDDLTIAYMSGVHDGKKQRTWVGLTDEEQKKIADLASANDWHDFDVIDATETKLKEKNA